MYAPDQPINLFSSGLPCSWGPIQEPAVEIQGLIFRIIGFPEIWSAYALPLLPWTRLPVDSNMCTTQQLELNSRPTGDGTSILWSITRTRLKA